MTPLPAALPTSSACEALSGTAFFDTWRAARLLDRHRKPIGAAGLGQAEFIWGKWLAFCSVRGVAWQATSALDVQAFTQDIVPRKPGVAGGPSSVSLRRYWRILNDMYAHAVLSKLIEANPALGAMPAASEKTSSLALPPHMWALLQQGLPAGGAFKARRKRLALFLMMRCALTVSEIVNLTLGSVQAHAGSPEEVAERLALAGLPLFEQEVAPGSPLFSYPALPPGSRTYALQLSGPRPAQTRQLVLDSLTGEALADWLEVRAVGIAGPDDRLMVGSARGAAITPMGLYGMCQVHMARCLEGYDIAQMGPNTLRNTCIVRWLNQGVALPEILRRCGLKDTELVIRLQRHLLPEVAL